MLQLLTTAAIVAHFVLVVATVPHTQILIHLSFFVTHSAKPITFYVTNPKLPATPSSSATTIQLKPKIRRAFVFSMMPDYWKSKFYALMMLPTRMMKNARTMQLCRIQGEHTPFPPNPAVGGVSVCFGHKAELSSALNAWGFVGWMEKRRRLIGKWLQVIACHFHLCAKQTNWIHNPTVLFVFYV